MRQRRREKKRGERGERERKDNLWPRRRGRTTGPAHCPRCFRYPFRMPSALIPNLQFRRCIRAFSLLYYYSQISSSDSSDPSFSGSVVPATALRTLETRDNRWLKRSSSSFFSGRGDAGGEGFSRAIPCIKSSATTVDERPRGLLLSECGAGAGGAGGLPLSDGAVASGGKVRAPLRGDMPRGLVLGGVAERPTDLLRGLDASCRGLEPRDRLPVDLRVRGILVEGPTTEPRGERGDIPLARVNVDDNPASIGGTGVTAAGFFGSGL